MRKALLAIVLSGLTVLIVTGRGPEALAAGKFGFLNAFEPAPPQWTPETTPEVLDAAAPVSTDLSEFYKEFERDGEVTIYVGYGYEGWFPERAPTLFNMLQSLAANYGTPLVNWRVSDDWRTIRFRHARRGVDYVIRIGTERDHFIEAFSKYEVVMYHGHSRYGQGPAFQAFTNYFRIGSNFDVIEVDTRNRYFRDEPLMKTDKYPPRDLNVDGTKLQYQYRGPKDHRSYLPDDSFTKLIPGRHTDLLKTEFLPGRQIFYFYSCKNRKYWQETVREVLPDPTQKAIIGTRDNAYGGTQPDALMIMEIVWREDRTSDIAENLNATGDCGDCFTSW